MYGWKRNVIKIEWAREAFQNLIGDAKHFTFTIEEGNIHRGSVRITPIGVKGGLWGWCTYSDNFDAVFVVYYADKGADQNFQYVFKYVQDQQRWQCHLRHGNHRLVMDGTPREMSKPRNFFYGKFVRKMA